MKARLEGEDWNGLQETIQEFGRLTPRDEYAKKIAAIKDRATKQQYETRTAILTHNAQAQINDVEAMIDRYLDDDTIRGYRRAIEEGRLEIAEKEKAKVKAAGVARSLATRRRGGHPGRSRTHRRPPPARQTRLLLGPGAAPPAVEPRRLHRRHRRPTQARPCRSERRGCAIMERTESPTAPARPATPSRTSREAG